MVRRATMPRAGARRDRCAKILRRPTRRQHECTQRQPAPQTRRPAHGSQVTGGSRGVSRRAADAAGAPCTEAWRHAGVRPGSDPAHPRSPFLDLDCNPQRGDAYLRATGHARREQRRHPGTRRELAGQPRRAHLYLQDPHRREVPQRQGTDRGRRQGLVRTLQAHGAGQGDPGAGGFHGSARRRHLRDEGGQAAAGVPRGTLGIRRADRHRSRRAGRSRGRQAGPHRHRTLPVRRMDTRTATSG